MAERVKVYSTTYCPYCTAAKNLLRRRGIPYEEIDVTDDDDKRDWLVKEANGMRTVPVIFVDEKAVGGYTELAKLDGSGKLKEMLAASPG